MIGQRTACGPERQPGLQFLLVPPKSILRETSEAVDDYLKAILELGGAEEARVTTQALAERLGVKTPSVTGMLQKLSSQRPALVLYEKHRGVKLSAPGSGGHGSWSGTTVFWSYFSMTS